MPEWVFTVSEVTEYIKRMISAEELLQNMQVRGEISGLKRAASGHIYFTLKDASSQMQCVFFRQDQNSSVASLVEGMQVTLSGRMALYTAAGQLNFYVKAVRNNGIGNLYAMLEQRKERLRKLGYFDEGHKKPIPAFPHTIGVVTSRQGAVIRDIIRVATRRNPHIGIVLYPVRVQGEGAAREIIRGIACLNERDDIDVIIVGRGGGSFEDLYEFNDEELVKTIYHSALPIISAVGHEVDFTLADFAADVRAATPSEAAEIAVPDREMLRRRVDELQARLERLAWETLQEGRGQLRAALRLLHANSPQEKLNQSVIGLDQLNMRLRRAARQHYKDEELRWRAWHDRLANLNPRAVLDRGYAMVFQADTRQFITAVEQVRPAENIRVLLRDGKLDATVTRRQKESSYGKKSEF